MKLAENIAEQIIGWYWPQRSAQLVVDAAEHAEQPPQGPIGTAARLRPTPATVLEQHSTWTLQRYRPDVVTGPPVLLVPPLAAPASCYDLRSGCSLVEYLLDAGHPVYLADYGKVSYADRAVGMENWIEDILPRSIERAARDADGRAVHTLGWSMGGQLAVLTAAHRPDLPIASLTTVASPFDYARIPVMAALRTVDRLVPRTIGDLPYRVLGGVPGPFVRNAFRLSGLDRHLLRPLTELRNRGNTDFLAHLKSVDDFTADMTAYPGRTFLQIYHHYFRSNRLATGTLNVAGHRISLDKIDKPVLIVSGSSDLFSPSPAAEHLAELLPSAPTIRTERVPGGHLGVITGRSARTTTWTHFTDFVTATAA